MASRCEKFIAPHLRGGGRWRRLNRRCANCFGDWSKKCECPMSMEYNNEGVDPNPISLTVRQLWSRRVAIAAAVLFFISWVFPITAGLAKNTEAFPKWWGVADDAIAFVLALLAILISA